MADLFTIPKLTVRNENLNVNVPTFKWDEFTRKEELGIGSFGSVYCGKYEKREEPVTVKVLRVQNRESKRLFVKEARLLHNLKGHKNIATFLAFCVEPHAIMMEYLYFDFGLFGVDKKVSSMNELLHFIDDHLDFTTLKSFQPKIARDIADGLCYLHEQGVVHRDLKPDNILVTNQHYLFVNEEKPRAELFANNPVTCKLADFGESRASYLQTQTLVSSQTHRVDRGTVVFMAPELHHQPLKPVSHEDLKKADIWAYGLVMYCLLNPDMDDPYQAVFAETGMNKCVDSLKCLLSERRLPKPQPKYEYLQVSEWWELEEAFELCAKFEPQLRPAASDLPSMFSVNQPEASLNLVQLAVSQATAVENADHALAEIIDQTGTSAEFHPATVPKNDGTNACVFLSLAICDRVLAAAESIKWTDLKTIAETIITEFPELVNEVRNIEEKYDPISAYSLLRKNNLVQDCSLSEEFIDPQSHSVFSISGRNHLINTISSQACASSIVIGLYTCDPYTFILGVHSNAFFILDTHKTYETLGGNGNGILLYTDDRNEKSCKRLVQWILKRLVQSGVARDAKQSLAWISRGKDRLN